MGHVRRECQYFIPTLMIFPVHGVLIQGGQIGGDGPIQAVDGVVDIAGLRDPMPVIAQKTGARHAQQALRHIGYRSEEHTSELQSLMRISYAVFCLKKKTQYKLSSY